MKKLKIEKKTKRCPVCKGNRYVRHEVAFPAPLIKLGIIEPGQKFVNIDCSNIKCINGEVEK